MALRRYFGKISPLQIGNLVGHNGELVIDEVDNSVYVMDGENPGGFKIFDGHSLQQDLSNFGGNIIPSIDNTYTIGSEADTWANAFINTINSDNIITNNFTIGNTQLYYQYNSNNLAIDSNVKINGNLNVIGNNLVFSVGGDAPENEVGRFTSEGLKLTGNLYFGTDNIHTDNEGHLLINDNIISGTSIVQPTNPNSGSMWYDADDGRLYVYYDNTWVDASPNNVYAIANVDVLGGIKVGQNLSITADGTLNAHGDFMLPTANASVKGGVKIGDNINVTLDGTISVAAPFSGNYSDLSGTPTPYTLPIATDIILGGVKIGENINSIEDGTISVTFPTPYTLPIASDTLLGGVKVDNVTIVADVDGVITAIGGGSGSVRVDNTNPPNPTSGTLWYDTISGRTYIYYNGTWIDSNPTNTITASGVGATYASGAFHQLTQSEAGKLITISGGNSLFRLPQITSNLLGTEFDFYFSEDAGQVYLQAFYTDNRATTDLFRGSVFVGVDNDTTGRLHTSTAGVEDANYLFLGQHHAKAGSYIRFKAIAFDSVGTWLVQGQCVGDTVNTTPNGQSYIFQNYYD